MNCIGPHYMFMITPPLLSKKNKTKIELTTIKQHQKVIHCDKKS
jgi:hypothetical protein